MINRSEQLAIASKDLMLREPFYGLFLIMLNKKWNERIPTAGVGKNGIGYHLYINPKFWDTLSDKHKQGLLKHELLHIGFFHLTDYDHLTDKDLSNIAKDLEINQYIAEDYLPEGAVTMNLFPELSLEPKKGTIYYYNKLVEGKKNGTCPNLNSVLEAMGKGEDTCSIGDEEVNLPDHGTWSEFDEMDEATKKLMITQTSHILNELAEQITKSRGSVPSEFEEILKRINYVEPPKFDWRTFLRRFVGGSTKVYTKKTRRKFNKRYEDSPGLKIKPKRHILVAIDTSGSVSTAELVEFMQEIHHMHKTGTEITIAQADAAISHLDKYRPGQDIFSIFGRGGTSFQPVIDYYNSNTHKYTCLIYLTDGEAPAPTPARGRMLWVMSSKSQINEDLVGPQIKLN